PSSDSSPKRPSWLAEMAPESPYSSKGFILRLAIPSIPLLGTAGTDLGGQSSKSKAKNHPSITTTLGRLLPSILAMVDRKVIPPTKRSRRSAFAQVGPSRVSMALAQKSGASSAE